jgi:hypothetical protein
MTNTNNGVIELYEDNAGGLFLRNLATGRIVDGLESMQSDMFDDCKSWDSWINDSYTDDEQQKAMRETIENEYVYLIAFYDPSSAKIIIHGNPGNSASRYLGAALPAEGEE